MKVSRVEIESVIDDRKLTDKILSYATKLTSVEYRTLKSNNGRIYEGVVFDIYKLREAIKERVMYSRKDFVKSNEEFLSKINNVILLLEGRMYR